MSRIFEVRKATMFKRWDKMAKQFSRIAKEIRHDCATSVAILCNADGKLGLRGSQWAARVDAGTIQTVLEKMEAADGER